MRSRYPAFVAVPPYRAVSPAHVRDALALARLLYEAEREAGADAGRLNAVAAAGKVLATAAQFAKGEPDSLGGRAAADRAREGIEKLAAVGWPVGVAELVEVTRKRVG